MVRHYMVQAEAERSDYSAGRLWQYEHSDFCCIPVMMTPIRIAAMEYIVASFGHEKAPEPAAVRDSRFQPLLSFAALGSALS